MGYRFFDRFADHAKHGAGVKMSLFPHLAQTIEHEYLKIQKIKISDTSLQYSPDKKKDAYLREEETQKQQLLPLPNQNYCLETFDVVLSIFCPNPDEG